MGDLKATSFRPAGSNADEWVLFLEDWRGSEPFIAVQIAEAIEQAEREACDRAIGRMGWPEIRAFHDELHKGQGVREDGGGFFMRAIGRLFGVKPKYGVVNYQQAATALVARARGE